MVVTKKWDNGIIVHAIQTGTVSVTKEHYEYSGLGFLRVPRILLANAFEPPMPIWVWCIQTPHGNYLIDTGESISFYCDNHFADKVERFINRRILNIHIHAEEQIHNQLASIGLSSDTIDAVLMTHLHIDHTDGIGFLNKSKFFVSKKDWEKPFGAPLSTFPKWFKPAMIEYSRSGLPFDGVYQFSKEIKIISTPGHTLGHQSVLLDVGEYQLLFAGDMTFTQSQLEKKIFGGIHLDIKKSRSTIEQVRQFSRESRLIYLPSHDPQSVERLQTLSTVRL